VVAGSSPARLTKINNVGAVAPMRYCSLLLNAAWKPTGKFGFGFYRQRRAG
jgi:hypothetical protein